MTLEQIANALARYQTASVNLDDSRKAQDEMYAANDCAVAWEAVRILLPIAQAAREWAKMGYEDRDFSHDEIQMLVYNLEESVRKLD